MQWIHEMMQIGFSYVCGPSNSLIFVCVYLPILLIVFTFDHFVVGLFSIVYLHSSFIFFFSPSTPCQSYLFRFGIRRHYHTYGLSVFMLRLEKKKIKK